MSKTALTPTGPLLGASKQDLMAWVEQFQQPAYRGQQLHQWLYQKGIHSLTEITVFPQQWRQALESVAVGRSQIQAKSVSADGTVKYLLKLADGLVIETVGIPTAKRLTVCVSSQVGCPMACDFCATGKSGFTRNLDRHEIVDQVLTVQADFGERVSHIVFMGMGEPLLNLDAVVAAVQSINQDIGIGQRNITISTVGVPQQIRRLAKESLQVTLAVSLHAPDQALREQLIPSAKHYPLDWLIQDCRDYVQQTKRRVSFEYTVLAGVNDTPPQAQALAKLIRGFQSHVNLIPYNPIDDASYQRPRPEQLQTFLNILKQAGVAASIRRSRGLERDAACGQLRTRLDSQPAMESRKS